MPGQPSQAQSCAPTGIHRQPRPDVGEGDHRRASGAHPSHRRARRGRGRRLAHQRPPGGRLSEDFQPTWRPFSLSVFSGSLNSSAVTRVSGRAQPREAPPACRPWKEVVITGRSRTVAP
jgi:hypothetical protein